jgi:hypothetical protein
MDARGVFTGSYPGVVVAFRVGLSGNLQDSLGAEMDANFTAFTSLGNDVNLPARHAQLVDVKRCTRINLHWTFFPQSPGSI